MAGRIPESFITELLARADIVEVINARVPLKKTGRNYVARCPFHEERTPSFTVSPSKQLYHCFGCGASGSVIRFLMEYDRLSFPEAVETLAAQYGLKVPHEWEPNQAAEEARRQRLQALYQINQEVAVFYAHQLKTPSGKAAVDYLRQRGVDGKTARRYGLGYAPPAFETLSRRFDVTLLKEVGLVVAKEDGEHYDRFRHRLIFPIRNRRGQVVGFGGRALDSRGPKYLNSPESQIFTKGREVYGLYELWRTGGRPARIVVVEGYLDVLALAQHGIPNAVAILGTAVTSEHIQLLFQHTEELVFCFDGDAAGAKAAWRALEAALPHLQPGRKVRFLWLPPGEDPDSLVRSQGVEEFTRRLHQAEPLSAYFFRAVSEGLDLSQLEDRLALRERARPLLRRLQDGEFRRMMEDRLVELAGTPIVERNVQAKPQELGLRGPRLEERVAALLLHHPRAFERLPAEFLEAARAGQHGELLAHLVSAWDAQTLNSELLRDKLQNSPYEAKLRELLAQKELQAIREPEKELLDAAFVLQRKARRLRLKALTQKADTEGLSAQEKAELRRLMGEDLCF
ncbi:DNA primase [Methylothermus subterraneus]